VTHSKNTLYANWVRRELLLALGLHCIQTKGRGGDRSSRDNLNMEGFHHHLIPHVDSFFSV
jgi:hypothetical protein